MKHLSSLSLCTALLAAPLAILISGCGAGVSSGSYEVPLPAIQGIVHGGPNPIVGATVTLYETQTGATANTGGTASTYGSTPLALQTATSGSYGQFTFTPSGYTCTSTEYAYVTVTGGNTGANAVNNNAVLMAPVGLCTTLTANTQIFVSELSTVASAYALGNFITVSGSAGSQVVALGAPTTNAAATPSCTVGGTSTFVTTACTAGGLGHAFANAAALVSSVGTNATPPTNTASTSMPNNANSSVPQALLDTLANILQSCVNSGSATGVSASCATLFSDAKPSGGTAPADTLSAAIDMAKNPTNNAGTLYGLASSTAFFQPSLVTAPTDLSLAVYYSAVPSGGANCPATVSGSTTSTPVTAYSYPNANVYNEVVSLALDISDDVFSVSTVPTNAIPNSLTDGMTYQGGCIFDGAEDIQPVTNGATTTQQGLANPTTLATDTLGHVWLTDNVLSNHLKLPRAFSQTTGAIQQTLTVGASFSFGLAVDRSNFLWMGLGATAGTGAFASASNCMTSVYPSGATYKASTTTQPVCNTATNEGAYILSIDTNQNIWSNNPGPDSVSPAVNTQASAAFVFANQTATATASYANTDIYYATLTANGVKSTGDNSISGVAVDSSGNAWFPTIDTLYKYTPALTASVITGIGTQTSYTTTVANPGTPNFDGTGTLWFPSYDASSTVNYSVAGTVTTLTPCYAASGATSCDYTHAAFGTDAQVDSTGAVWVALYGNQAAVSPVTPNAGLLEIIGTAAPTWPQLSWGHPGAKP
jgi:hypothetical protein